MAKNTKYKYTINILRIIKSHIENKFKIVDCNIYENKEDFIYSKLTFKIPTKYYDVPVKISRNLNYKREITMSLKFKNLLRDNTNGYSLSIYNQETDLLQQFANYIDFQSIDDEIERVIKNMKENSTWCDESKYLD